MAHDDVCPCKHGNYVCLIGCDQCQPGLVVPDDWWEQAKEAYHRVEVENERLRRRLREVRRD